MSQKCKLGMIGLGVMGQNFALNLADKGFAVAGFDVDKGKVNSFRDAGKGKPIATAQTMDEFLSKLSSPKVVMMLVPAGAPVDAVLKELVPKLSPGDIVIDGGNSYYKDTSVRFQNLAKKGIYFFGVGVSGGEEGARHGPSLMPGGNKEAYPQIASLLEAASAKVNGDPCVAYLGPGCAGHFVKMVHNGIEYALMELIAESYDLMKRGLGFDDESIETVFKDWNKSELKGYLVEITSRIFGVIDPNTHKRLIDEILAVAKQKGTGMWTSQAAGEMQVPIPTIDTAVSRRDLTGFVEERILASTALRRKIHRFEGDKKLFLDNLKKAFHTSMIISYAQGMALLKVASEKMGFDLDLETVARIWRGGCIIRSDFLERIRKAFKQNPTLPNILLDSDIDQTIFENEEGLRYIVSKGVEMGISIPSFMASISYLDGYRSEWLPANLIQAERDYFGAHTYERIDEKGTFHTNWEQSEIV